MKNIFYLLLLFCVCGLKSSAQNVNIKENPKIAKLLVLKAEMTAKSEIGSRYSIQLGSFNSLAKAKKTKAEFDSNYDNLSSRIKYEPPNYKVWIGNFTSRLQAERIFLEVKKVFKSAFVFKPSA